MKKEENRLFEDNSDCYRLHVECMNCGASAPIWIKKGTGYRETPCANCGCVALGRVDKIPGKLKWGQFEL